MPKARSAWSPRWQAPRRAHWPSGGTAAPTVRRATTSPWARSERRRLCPPPRTGAPPEATAERTPRLTFAASTGSLARQVCSREHVAMRRMLAWVLGAVVLMGVSTTVEAKRSGKKPKQYAARQVPHAPRGPADDSQWYARDASKLPFGSSIWWDQMLRENRLTCCN